MRGDVHIEGMGWLGAALAWHLDYQGIDFTWHDTDSQFVAWKASTGLVYPANDFRTLRDLKTWAAWLDVDVFPAGTVEPVCYVYTNKKPPFGMDYPEIRVAEHYTLADHLAFSVNAPEIVTQARRVFAPLRLDSGRHDAAHYVRAHSGDRLSKYMWGWSARVHLTPPPVVAEAMPGPVAYASRVVRTPVYAYPIPGTDLHWAGSQLTQQSTPRELPVMGHLQKWMERFPALFPGMAVELAEEPRQGWRPRPADHDDGARIRSFKSPDGQRWVHHTPAMWHSGIRWSPGVIDPIVKRIQESL